MGRTEIHLERNYDSEVISIIATVLKNSTIRVVDLQSLARVSTAISEKPLLIKSPVTLLNHIRQMLRELKSNAGAREDQITFYMMTDYLIRRIRDAVSTEVTDSQSESPFEAYFDQADETLEAPANENDPFAQYLNLEYKQVDEVLPEKCDDFPLGFYKEDIVKRIEAKIASNFKEVDGKPIFIFKGSGKALRDLMTLMEGFETITDKEKGEVSAWLEQIIESLKKFVAVPQFEYTHRDIEDAEAVLREYTIALYVRQQEEEVRFIKQKVHPLPSYDQLETVITKRIAEQTITRYIRNILSNDLNGLDALFHLVIESVTKIKSHVKTILLTDPKKLSGSIAGDNIRYFSDIIKEIVLKLNSKIEKLSIDDCETKPYRDLMHSILDEINTTVITIPSKNQTFSLFPSDLIELASQITEASARWVGYKREA